jgi:predicted DNA-binding protein (MmcQ/YjbR family)
MPLSREDVRARCAAFRGATSDYPFGPEVQIFRIGGRIFALLSEVDARVSLKCDPGLAEILRQTFTGVIPGYHLNKRHWNTVELDGSVPDGQVIEMIGQSYELVLASLPKKAQAELRGPGA